MTTRALSIVDLARVLGKSQDWLRDHWRKLVRDKKLPPPLLDEGHPTWDAGQVYAMIDAKLPAAVRANAAAYRAALEAAVLSPRDAISTNEIAEHRNKLDARFGSAS